MNSNKDTPPLGGGKLHFKLKGLRWWVIGLIMVITIINYLDRGTLNYMWIANVEYDLLDEFDISLKKNQAKLNNSDSRF